MNKKLIALIVEDTPALLTGVLGILKSGSVLVPINPVYPDERIQFIIRDCNIKIVLCDRFNHERALVLKNSSSVIDHVICIDDLKPPKQTSLPPVRSKDALSEGVPCYVIFTSGTTGIPKGVLIHHGNLVPLLKWFMDYFRLGNHTRVLHNLSYTFDFGIFELLTTLFSGGTLYLADRERSGDFNLWCDMIHANDINTLHTTPAFFMALSSLNRSLSPLRLLHLGGEKVTGTMITQASMYLHEDSDIYNGYGPTEATINCSIYHIPSELRAAACHLENIPIGKPSARHSLFIMDKWRQPLPIGIAGELWVGGEGVAPGYLNRPELTFEAFLSIQPRISSDTQTFYRTGDLVKWLSDGNILFLGRIDQQVKIRGYRIELGEITNTLLKFPGISDAAVTAREDQKRSTSYLCAYIVPDENLETDTFSLSGIREFLLSQLPDYMVPATFVPMEELPYGSSGKVNLNALPEPGENALHSDSIYIAPQSDTEKRLAEIWNELHNVGRISVTDDFFEIGGDSISANQCMVRIREEFNVNLSLRKFFEKPYIRGLASEIAGMKKGIETIEPAPRDKPIPLSFPQERLWFLQQLDSENVAYFVPRVIRMKGVFKKEWLVETLTRIVDRHEILRTVFPVIDGNPVQKVLPPYEFPVPLLDWSQADSENQEEKVNEFLQNECRNPFDLTHGPLLRVTLIRLDDRSHIVVLTENHLIHDGWTQGVLLKEFIATFTAVSESREPQLPELPIQYADYAIWQREYLTGERLEYHLNYWREQLNGLPPVLELPLDYPRPESITGNGALIMNHLSPEMTQKLKIFCKENNVTLFMTMLSVFKLLLFRYSGVEDICVGTGIANRGHKEMEGMLGMVINSLALRTNPTHDLPFEYFLRQVKNTCQEAYQHEDTPFGKVVEELQPERSLRYTPLFQIMFSFMDTPAERLRLPGLDLELETVHNRSAKFDLNLVVVPPDESGTRDSTTGTGETLIEWEFNTDIFKPARINRMIAHYNRMLDEIMQAPETPLAKVPMLSDEEMRQLVIDFNATDYHHPGEKPVHEMFREQAEKSPDAVAVTGKEKQVTHAILMRNALRISGSLMNEGAVAGDIIAIYTERSG